MAYKHKSQQCVYFVTVDSEENRNARRERSGEMPTPFWLAFGDARLEPG